MSSGAFSFSILLTPFIIDSINKSAGNIIMETLSKREKIHYTNQWCRSIGIRNKDLTNHPSIDDVILLVNFRNEFWQDLTKIEQATWSGFWSIIYHRHYTLKATHLVKLELMAQSALFTRQKQQQRQGKIRALRARAQEQNERCI